MKQYEPSRSPCPLGRASRVLGDRWVILVLRELFLGAHRFEDFMRRLPISRAALTSRLAMLQDAGIIARDPPEAKRASYRLTEAGLALQPVLEAIGRWGTAHLFAPGEERPRWGGPSANP